MQIQTININAKDVSDISLAYSEDIIRITYLIGLDEVSTKTLTITPELKNDFNINGIKAFIEQQTDIIFI